MAFSWHLLYDGSATEPELDAESVAGYHALILEAESLGLTPIGVSGAWTIPPLPGLPLTPASPHLPDPNVPEARVVCIPDQGEKYVEMAHVRDQMFEALASEFAEIQYWLVGYDPTYSYFDCRGEQMDLPELVPFMVDTLHRIRQTLRQASPGALVIADFLGSRGIPIVIRSREISPRDMMNLIRTEISRRGADESDYFDSWVSDLFPDVLLDRPGGGASGTPLWAPGPEYRRRTKPGPGTGPRAAGTQGWNIKYLQEFPNSSFDVSVTYADWDDIQAGPSQLQPTTASGNRAIMSLVPPPTGFVFSVNGIKTNPAVDIVPDQEFDSSQEERNRWVVVGDYYEKIRPTTHADSHNAVFLRVNERDWDPNQAGNDNQTRFGCFFYAGITSRTNCNNTPCGSLQLESDRINASTGVQKLLNFQLSEDPWSYSSHLYRCQLVERQYLDHVLGWQLAWQAEVYDLTDNSQLIGTRPWIVQYLLTYLFSMEIPPLNGSELMVAFGFDDGKVELERTGSAYWIY